jgi:hypothetical protein
MIGNNMFVYCLNNPIIMKDYSGTIPFADDPFSETYQQIGSWLSPYVMKFWKALSGSCSLSGEVGSGFGVSGKIGPVSTEVAVIIVADEWTVNADGSNESIERVQLLFKVNWQTILVWGLIFNIQFLLKPEKHTDCSEPLTVRLTRP